MNILLIFIIISLLVFFNAFYVAAEFATASSRRPRLTALANSGNRMAKMLLPIVDSPTALDNYIAACQLGITVTSLVLGFYGQAALADYITPIVVSLGGDPLAAESIAVIIILILLTTVQVLFGELIPKNIGVRYPERLAMMTIVPMRWSMILFKPLIWVFNGSAQVILRLFGRTAVGEHAHVHHPDEIVLLVQESGEGGVIDIGERELVERTLTLHEHVVRQVMKPRTRIFAASVEETPQALLTLLANSTYSRLPLYKETIDSIVGTVHLRELLCAGAADEPDDVRTIMKPPFFVPEAMPLDEVLVKLQQNRRHMAFVVDEYGGTAGLVTIEDLLEEIFGEIQDEFDFEDLPIRKVNDQNLLVRADLPVTDLNYWLDLRLPEDEGVSLAGLFFSQFGGMPVEGDRIEMEQCHLQVERMHGNEIQSIMIEASPIIINQWQGGEK